jgi:uncharacterized membrane protein HdeD (DUF308 family)
MFKSLSTSLILRDVLAITVGIIAIAWPGVTMLALGILFTIYPFIDAGSRLCGRSAAAPRARSSATCCWG